MYLTFSRNKHLFHYFIILLGECRKYTADHSKLIYLMSISLKEYEFIVRRH